MKIITNRITFIIICISLIIGFGAGYLMGSKSHQRSIEQPQALTATDMDHAFGNVKVTPHEKAAQDTMAMSLSGLVTGLEQKVAANPENIDQQLLLAQTYNELDNRDKSLSLLRKLNKSAPSNAQVKITLATVLMKSTDKQELKESLQRFDEAIKLNPDMAKMAGLYQGEVKVKLSNMPK